GDSVFENYKFKRRLYLLVCYVILIGVSLAILWTLLLAVLACGKLNCSQPGGAPYSSFYLYFIFALVAAVLLIGMTSASWLWGSVSAGVYSASRRWFLESIESLPRVSFRLLLPGSPEISKDGPPAGSRALFIAFAVPSLILSVIACAVHRLLNG